MSETDKAYAADLRRSKIHPTVKKLDGEKAKGAEAVYHTLGVIPLTQQELA